MNLYSTKFPNSSEDQRRDVLIDCARSYIFNKLTIADEDDEGGLDHPLEHKHKVLQPFIQSLLDEELIGIEPYEEDGESGEEYVPAKKGKKFLKKRIKTAKEYQEMELPADDIENVRKAFFFAVESCELDEIDERFSPWYQQISSFQFLENLVPESAPEENKQGFIPEFDGSEHDTYDDPTQNVEQVIDKYIPPDKTYRYTKPAIIHAIIAAILILIYLISNWIWGLYSGLFFSCLSIFYYLKLFSFKDGNITLSTILGSESISYEDIAETSLVENEDYDYDGSYQNDKTIEIIGENGDTITVTNWIDDFSGLVHRVHKSMR